MRPSWRLAIGSALLYTLAFNLTFFIQELFLVVPKALTPGLRPTLFHNNHSWEGTHPLASLFQGTGALAIFISAIVCMLLLRGSSHPLHDGPVVPRLDGVQRILPGAAAGRVRRVRAGQRRRHGDGLLPHDSRRQVESLHSAQLAAMIPIGSCLAREMLRVMPLKFALSALAAIPLIVAFRVPREPLEVLLPPVLATVVGLTAVYATAWRVKGVSTPVDPQPVSIAYPLAAVVALLLIFQLVLRPGIAFY